MKPFKVFMFLILIIIFTGPVFAGGQKETEQQTPAQQETFTPERLSDKIIQNTETSITIVDDLGHEIEVAQPVKKLLSLMERAPISSGGCAPRI